MALLILSASPFLLFSVFLLVTANRVTTSALSGDPVADVLVSELKDAAFSAGLAVFAIIAICALAYIALAVAVVFGQNWVRTMLAVLTTLWGLVLLVMLAGLLSVPAVSGWSLP